MCVHIDYLVTPYFLFSKIFETRWKMDFQNQNSPSAAFLHTLICECAARMLTFWSPSFLPCQVRLLWCFVFEEHINNPQHYSPFDTNCLNLTYAASNYNLLQRALKCRKAGVKSLYYLLPQNSLQECFLLKTMWMLFFLICMF